ncbi:murein transglycosylase A [Hyphobacterium sp. HN65]|uniref:peptidoglycan lytic exotransglycosylase n=1 Tax=Hyphobacterium lacteum TaxID=3116575 RepID=A0ABU7LRU4_9PROT|nr:murein transglycosylase A [Hyphobacterium sp. HN65]MEE2526637.1 murein transglycosylase A [Hyphobacterium sp. HN65]
MFVRLSAIALGLFLLSCERAPEPAPEPEPEITEPPAPVAGDLVFEGLDWSEVPGWPEMDTGPAMAAFGRSCAAMGQLPPGLPMSERAPLAGPVGDWQAVCRDRDATDPQAFFETRFVPVRVRTESAETGLLTGYYEPMLEVRHEPDAEFSHPIRARPDDLLMADLGAFSEELSGHRIMGMVDGNRFVPYRSRNQIELAESGEPLAWGRPIDVFFLQIQGSGRLVFEGGETVRAAFAAHNGLPYASIGRELVARGELELHQASKAGIEAWLEANGPAATAELFSINRRYIFFGLENLPDPDLGPRGGSGLPLTPMGSIAVDPSFLPYGVPVILGADLPDAPAWRGMLVTQDTGGAITGPMRGDLFYGWGETAERRAGSTRSQADWIILLPHAVAERLLPPA